MERLPINLLGTAGLKAARNYFAINMVFMSIIFLPEPGKHLSAIVEIQRPVGPISMIDSGAKKVLRCEPNPDSFRLALPRRTG
jgi:hypothetical protein